MKRTPAEKMAIIFELMNIPIVDEKGNPVLDENGEQKTFSLITKEEALKLLGHEE